MGDIILAKETVVDYKIPVSSVNAGKSITLGLDQYLFFNLRNHCYNPRPVYTSRKKDILIIRLTFKVLNYEIVNELEDLLELYPGQLLALVEKAKESISQRAEENVLSVDLDAQTEISEPQKEMTSGMHFFELTELSHTLLKRAINAYSNILHLATYRNDPEAKAMNLDEIKKNRDIALETLRNSRFSSLEEMEYIIQTYSSIVKELYHA